MLCDIPCRMSINQVLDAINQVGFSRTYDLVYVPSRPGSWRPKKTKSPQNMGYAFVNFTKPEFAAQFTIVFKDFAFPDSASTKLTFTKPAHTQGYEAHLQMHMKQRWSGCLVTLVEDEFGYQEKTVHTYKSMQTA